MLTILIVFVLCLVIVRCTYAQQTPTKQENNQTLVDKWVVDLNKRNFSDDIDSFKESVKETTRKAKDSIQKYTPEVKRLVRSFGDYLKR